MTRRIRFFRGFLRLAVLLPLVFVALLAACTSRTADQPPESTPPPATEEPPPNQEPNQEQPSHQDPDNLFAVDAIRPGDTVAGLEVVTVDYQGGDGGSPLSATVSFSGEVAVTGTYIHHPEGVEFVGGQVCMEQLDAASEAKLPRMRGDERILWFCFTNGEKARQALAPAGVGVATVVIDDYTIDYRPTETWNTARLVRVEKARVALPWSKPVTTSIEGTPATATYRLVYFPNLPFVTYVPEDWVVDPLQEGETVGVRLSAGDIGFVEVQFFAPGTPREEVDAAVTERLAVYPESQPEDPEPWAEAAFRASDRTPKDPSAWRVGRLYVGQRGDRFFTVLSHLDRMEGADGWGPRVDAILNEWRWLDTGGEPLRPSDGDQGRSGGEASY